MSELWEPRAINDHSCFHGKASARWGRVYLPVAPQCNIQCNFCNRLYDCVNESRPGVARRVLEPADALEDLNRLLKQRADIAERAAVWGADTMNCIALIPVHDTPFENFAPPAESEMARIRNLASVHIPQIYHCRRCRADAIGLLYETRGGCPTQCSSKGTNAIAEYPKSVNTAG